MLTIDTNPTHGIALVQNSADWRGLGNDHRYVPLKDAPPLDPEIIPQVYMRQLHYVAGHVAINLIVHERILNGARPPKDGWTRWWGAA